MREPLPALYGSLWPLTGSPISLCLVSAARTVLPMSKHFPVLLR